MELTPSNQPPPKRANLESKVDRISTLPDEILTHILSFLSTKMAFRTGILSSRWESLWTFVPNLYFFPTYRDYHDPRYMNFIEDVLLSHKSSINKFHLTFSTKFDISRVTAWIRAAVKRNVREIDIYGHHKCDKPLLLPRNLYTCKTLVRLYIGHNLQPDVPSSIHFPCLKFLDISVVSPSKNLTEKLFCSSLVLEELNIHVVGDSGEMIYNIASPVLKKLDMNIRTSDIENSNSVVVIDAPVLESFGVFCYCFMLYNFKDSSSLLKAQICLDARGIKALKQRGHDERLFNLVESVSAVKDLSIHSSSLVTAFGMATERKREIIPNVTSLSMDVDDDISFESLSMWPDFVNLTHLNYVMCGDFASNNLLNFLGRTPNLVSLVIIEIGNCTSKFNIGEQVVPSCFLTCLREVKMRVDDNSKGRIKLIRYLLANAKVLENLTLGGILEGKCSGPMRVKWFESKILTMQRCSEDCQILLGENVCRW